MIKFSLKRILESAPYELVLADDEFTFQTDFNIHYSVSFNRVKMRKEKGEVSTTQK